MNLDDLSIKEKEELAEKLHRSLCAGINISTIDDDIKKLNLKIINDEGYTEFKPTLKIILRLCNPASTRKQRELLAKAYSWLGAEYRQKAIQAINDFLNIDLHLHKREPYPLFINGKEVFNMERESQICMMTLFDLSRAYEGEYLFQLSLDILNTTWVLFPNCFTTLALKFNILRKMNRLSEIINIINYELLEDWTQPYTYIDHFGKEFYRENNRRSLLVERDKYQKLIDNGYIYKPRPRKRGIN